MFIWDLLVFILGLSILIMVHELGHFLCAKAFNVYCHEFSIGMGPVVVKTQKGETQYSIRALPIGGFVSMAGEGVDEATNIQKDEDKEVIDVEVENNVQVEEEKPNIPYERTINGIAAWKRFIVISAGVIMNFIFSFVFLFIYLLATGMPDGDVRLIADKDSIAYQAGITSEIRVNGVEIIHVSPDGSEDIYIKMSDAYGADSLNVYLTESSNKIKETKIENMNQCVVFRYQDGDENKLTNRVCRSFNTVKDEQGNESYTSKSLFGIQIGEHFSKIGAGKAFVEAGKLEWELGTMIFKSLGTLFTKEGFSQVSGVVGIFSVSQQFQKMGFGYYMYFLGFISVNLGVMNLLPIPGLDGSQLIVIGIEGITRKKISNRVKAIINGVGLVFLLLLMGVIMIKDIIGLF